MQLLLTSSGISNPTIEAALVRLLGRPVAECRALVIPTAIYPFASGPQGAATMIRGQAQSPLCELGWSSLGVLELTALPSIRREVWTSAVEQADALLVWGGDPVYLAHWLRESGLAAVLPTLPEQMVYVGVSAGAIATAAVFGETYREPPGAAGTPLSTGQLGYTTPDGPASTAFVTAEGAGLVEFAVIPHVDHDDPADLSLIKAWAAAVPVPTYALDDQSAVAVSGGTVEVVSEGRWSLLQPSSQP